MILFQWLNKNLFVKVASILLAALFFFIHRYTNLDSISLQLPIQISIPENSAIYWQDISSAKVVLRGAREEIEQLDRRNIFLEVNIDQINPAVTHYRIELGKSLQNQQLSSFSISIQPPAIQIQLEPIITKQVAIEPVLLGQPAKGYTHQHTQVSPQIVEVKGPESQLASLLNIRTMPIDISNLTHSFEQKVALNYKNSKIDITPDEISVKVSINSQFLYIYSLDLPLTVINLKNNLYVDNINQITGTAIIESRFDDFQQLDFDNALLLLNLAEITSAGSYSLKPQLRNLNKIPDDYNIIVETMTIHIKESPNE